MTQIRSDQFTITRCQFSKGLIRKNRNRERGLTWSWLVKLSNSIYGGPCSSSSYAHHYYAN